MHPASPRRAGFVLVWILLTVALLAILAAVVAPAVATTVDRKRAIATAATLQQITAGIVAFELVVHKSGSSSTHDYPGDVSQLSIVVRPNLDNDSCGNAMTAHDSTDWIAEGPFVPMYIPLGGLWTPIGRIADDIPTRTSLGDVYILIPGVRAADAAMLNDIVDHGSGDTVSTLHAAINDTTTVRYRALSAAQAPDKC
jgi:type II secretory pathway pseudopilin PulG